MQNEARSVGLDSAVLRTYTTPNQPYNPLERKREEKPLIDCDDGTA